MPVFSQYLFPGLRAAEGNLICGKDFSPFVKRLFLKGFVQDPDELGVQLVPCYVLHRITGS